MTRVLAVANQKGGVAKTTTVASFGAAMAEKGRRVLLVDLDPQGCLTFSLGQDPDKLTVSIHEVLLGDGTALTNDRLDERGNAALALGLLGERPGGVLWLVPRPGRAVDADARRKLFEPFFTTKPAGTGLGLAISQSIARAHRGTIEVGTSPRGGALFTLRVPRAAPATETERSRDP